MRALWIIACSLFLFHVVQASPGFPKPQSVFPLKDSVYVKLKLCTGQSINLGDTIANQTGTYLINAKNQAGEDSVYRLDLTYFPFMDVNFGTYSTCFGQNQGKAELYVIGGTKPFTFAWDWQNATSPVLENLPAGVYTATVTDANGCSQVQKVQVTQTQEARYELSRLNARCPESADGKILVQPFQGGLTYGLEPDTLLFQEETVFSGLPKGLYRVYVRDHFGCVYSDTISIQAPPPIVLDLPDEITINLGDTANLGESIVPDADLSYTWSPDLFLSCDNCFNPSAWPDADLTYQLVVTDLKGCTSSRTISVRVIQQLQYFAPSAFSPNGDGFNDRWMIFPRAGVISEIEEISIYDRWGGHVFRGLNLAPLDLEAGWDGKVRGEPAPVGVYVYLAVLRLRDGSQVVLRGDLTLLR